MKVLSECAVTLCFCKSLLQYLPYLIVFLYQLLYMPLVRKSSPSYLSWAFIIYTPLKSHFGCLCSEESQYWLLRAFLTVSVPTTSSYLYSAAPPAESQLSCKNMRNRSWNRPFHVLCLLFSINKIMADPLLISTTFSYYLLMPINPLPVQLSVSTCHIDSFSYLARNLALQHNSSMQTKMPI